MGLRAVGGNGQLVALIHQGEGHTGFVLHYPAHLGALLGVQPGYYGAALAGGHIGPDAALNAHQMGAVCFSGGELGGEHRGIAGLFNIGHGEIGVRCDGVGGIGVAGVVVLDVPGAGLLVGAQHQFDVLAQGQPQFLHTAHGHHCGHGGALVVIGAPAIDQVAVAHQRERVGVPAVADAHHVQMGQNVELIGLIVQVDRAHIAFVFAGGQPPLPGQLQRGVQRHGRTGAEGFAGLRGAGGGINGDQGRQSGDVLILAACKPRFNAFIHCHVRFPLFVRNFRLGICRRCSG